MNTVKAPATFDQVLKAPVTYMLMVAVSFLVYTFGALKESNDDRYKACVQEVQQLRAERERDREERLSDKKTIHELVVSNLVSKGIIDELKSRDIKDSLRAGQETQQ